MQHPLKRKRRETLAHRIRLAEHRIEQFGRLESRYPWYRLAALITGLLAIYLAFQLLHPLFGWLAGLLALLGFAYVAGRHNRLIDQMTRLRAFRDLLIQHAARLELDWERIPPPADIHVPAEHPFAGDLDITGSRSLHQLLDTSTSLGGSRRLAGWLLEPVPDAARIQRNQRLVAELLARPAYRTRLELNGLIAAPSPGQRWDTQSLLRWLESHADISNLRLFLVALGLLALVNVVLFSLNAVGMIPPFWIGTLALYLALQSLKFRESSEVFQDAYGLARQLGRLRVLLADLEEYPYDPGGLLVQVCAPFLRQPGQRPSAALRRIGWIASAASLRNNPFLGLVLNLLAPWDLFFAYQLERYKQSLRGTLPAWLDAWHELEALTALANFAALNPANHFPEILPLDHRPVLACAGIGHPLIPDTVRVENDFTLNDLGEVIIITGSNMSGKSTFLRTLGVNLVLAGAGSTVAAQSLRTLPFRLFTSMTLNDSLSDGISFFYAEVRRLKALLVQLEADHPLPLFFLVDEIFRGTNNRERQIGSRAYTRALAGKNGAGLISTHDLELVHLAERIPGVHNYHFREEIQGGKMVFDYTIRAGASPSTNALRIMALAGLPVEGENGR